ncbi:MAG: hypothetical protein KFF73_08545 [Cyclobacteriaceae bacterium]|nr:hypothetical protein [Cyclobacteriaceae bacterium]
MELIHLISGTYAENAGHYLPWAYSQCNIDCMDEQDDSFIHRDFVTVSSDFYTDLGLHYEKELKIEFPKWIEAWKEANHG